MNDLEITILCAEAMGWIVEPFFSGGPRHSRVRTADGKVIYGIGEGWIISHWNPLHDDSQVMMLLKRFRFTIDDAMSGNWLVVGIGGAQSENEDLNRAICECVAKMQHSKDQR